MTSVSDTFGLYANLRAAVTIVSPGTGTSTQPPVLLVPFQPSAIVTAFVDELYKRIARQGLPIAPNTHVATLHLDATTGGIIDFEDVLSDAVTNPKSDKIFAVFAKKANGNAAPASGVTSGAAPVEDREGDTSSVFVRVVTASTAKNKDSCRTLRIPLTATIRQLHDRVSEQLEMPPNYDSDMDQRECNCSLAGKLADDPGHQDSFVVIHDKSIVERVRIDSPTEQTVKAALRHKFGPDIESTKRVALVGADVHTDNLNLYKKNPTVAICSKHRHTPAHARVDYDETGQRKSRVLDLHTSEQPIHPICMEATLEDTGLRALAVDGVTEIYVVNRNTVSQSSAAIGKAGIFRARTHWEPSVVQSDRGIAIFLSSLRVFVSLVQDMRQDERSQDAVLHTFDLLAQFPPALRSLFILMQGKTPTTVESAAFSHAIFNILDDFMPTDIIGTDHHRVFEGARLLFGFVLEKARTLKLSAEEGATLPYLSSLEMVEQRDYRTNEAVMRAVQTANGLVESNLFDAFQEGDVLASSRMQTYMVKKELNANLSRWALMSGGATSEIAVFSASKLHSNYRYADAGDAGAGIDCGEWAELNHLAELCGRNKLAVHKPSQLANSVAPCLTFDRNAHLAVYTGEQPCGDPGHSSILFRPRHGDETIDAAVIEQLIAPILAGYEADGTAVFDALGGAAVRRLHAPDEVLMICVDCSASMRQATDFAEVNDPVSYASDDSDAQNLVEGEFYNRASFDEMKELLCNHEGFSDMIAIIAETGSQNQNWIDNDRRFVAGRVLTILRAMLSSTIIKKNESLTRRRSHGRGWYHVRQQVASLEAEVEKLKTFWAGLKTHEESVVAFLIYRATSSSHEIGQKWTWSIGDSVPSAAVPPQQIPNLDPSIIQMPDQLRCPISHTLMEDEVTATDGHNYSHAAISHWFSIRSSSPMTGLDLQDTSLSSNPTICDAAARWVNGDGLFGRESSGEHPTKRLRSKDLEVTFDSRVGSFSRKISRTMNLKNLYKLAFRGLKARALVFQLSTNRYGPLTPTPEADVSSRQIRDGDHINIRIAEDDPTTNDATGSEAPPTTDMVLVKVYEDADDILFGYWVKKNTAQTLESVLWKYWRSKISAVPLYSFISAKQVWTDMNNSGDQLLTGTPQDNTEKLAALLTRQHCFGHLGAEKVYKEDTVMQGFGQPLVLKVKICPPWQPQRERNTFTRLDVLKQMFEVSRFCHLH